MTQNEMPTHLHMLLPRSFKMLLKEETKASISVERTRIQMNFADVYALLWHVLCANNRFSFRAYFQEKYSHIANESNAFLYFAVILLSALKWCPIKHVWKRVFNAQNITTEHNKMDLKWFLLNLSDEHWSILSKETDAKAIFEYFNYPNYLNPAKKTYSQIGTGRKAMIPIKLLPFYWTFLFLSLHRTCPMPETIQKHFIFSTEVCFITFVNFDIFMLIWLDEFDRNWCEALTNDLIGLKIIM